MRLILAFFHSAKAGAARRLIFRSISSGSKSVTVVPSSTRPSRLTAPASKSRAEASEVFPQPPCPTMATLRMFGASYTFMIRGSSRCKARSYNPAGGP